MRSSFRCALSALVLVAGLLVGLVATPPVAALAGTTGHDRLVSDNPANYTPNVLDGRVNAIVQVGSKMIAGGAFSSVSPAGTTAGTTRRNIFAFDATTGAIDDGFQPTVDGGIESIVVAPDGQSVYIAGLFTTVNGVRSKGIERIDVRTGASVAGFTPPALNGVVFDAALHGGRLFLAGTFTKLGAVARTALATLNPQTGANDAYLDLGVSGVHNGGSTSVAKLDIAPDGSRMVFLGNFSAVKGQTRNQLAVADLSATGATLADWSTTRYQPACASGAFNTYLRDVDISGDSTYFVVATTGAPFGGTLCDTAARWELKRNSADQQPSWVNYSGGDTLTAVEIVGPIVYVGGHQRWVNNPSGADSPGPGAVSRPGLVALDPANGLPFSWNPGRTRGVAVYDFLATSTGLWFTSDTDRVAGELRGRLAFFPLAGGQPLPSTATGTLPGDVYLGGVPGGTNSPVLYRVNAGGAPLLSTDGGPDWIGDTGDGSDSYRNAGSNAAGWSPVPDVDGTVPTSTPRAVFDSERWDPGDAPELQWDFPVPAGQTVEVRLYFANRCGCTAGPGQRVFDVSIDGTTVLDDFDIVSQVGHDRGTMRTFPVTSDGTVDIDFGHVVENPLVNGIEVVRTGAQPPAGSPDDLLRRQFDGSTAGPTSTVPGTGVAWSQARGAVMIGNAVYTGWSDGELYRRTFDGTTFGPATVVSTADQLTRLQAWHDVVPSITGMFFADGRLYYTVAGRSTLSYRYFEPESGVVGAQEFEAVGNLPDLDWRTVGGMFVSGGKLYAAHTGTGALRRVDLAGGVPVGGTVTTVSGPAVDGSDWRGRAMFLFTGPANRPPTASFASSCTGLSCSFDGSGSSDPDGSISSYAWTFGDGASATGATASHAYGTAGTYTVGLTVTDNRGATATTTRQVTVAEPAASPISFVGGSRSNSATLSQTVTVPPGVQAGDALLLVLSYNSTSTFGAPTGVTGWTAVGTRVNGAMTTVVYQKAAAAGDGGRAVTLTQDRSAKADLQLLAYTGTRAGTPVAAHAAAADEVAKTSHTTPTVDVATAGSWVVSYWADRSSTTSTDWTAPAGQTVRVESVGTGGGRLDSLSTDAGAPVATGTYGGLTATTDTAGGRATMWSIVLAPAG